MSNSGSFKIRVERRAEDGWYSLEEKLPDEMAELKAFLKRQPANTRITNGKAKKLKGRLKEYLQYDMSYSDRVRYSVDKHRGVVTVVYAGPHP